MKIKWNAGTGSILGELICRFWYGKHLAEYDGSESWEGCESTIHCYHCTRCGQKGTSWTGLK